MLFRSRLQVFRTSAPLLAVGLFLAAGLVWASTPASMPRRITERLWSPERIEQDGRDAPKLLLIYPRPDTRLLHHEELTRYAGRVEPPGAEVQLDGTTISIHPGGVFTGLLKVPEGQRTIQFTASSRGRTTSVSRTVRRASPPPPLEHRPLRFGGVTPGGEQSFLLQPGSAFRVSVTASPGNVMRGRIGSSGDWFTIRETQSGLYSERIVVDQTVSSNVAQPLQFELRPAGPGGSPESVRMTSSIQVRRLGPRETFPGVVESDLATFLKEPEGWNRWGNWIRDTPFTALERYGDRYRVDFGQGRDGFIEADSVKVRPAQNREALPNLGAPEVRFYGNPEIDRVTVDWNTTYPVAHVFEPVGGPAGRELRVELTGAGSTESAGFRAPSGIEGGLSRVDVLDTLGGRPPEVRVRMEPGELWGYGFSMVDPTTLRLTVRTRPRPGAPSSRRPLEGLSIVVDAGHGGSDLGALGPSGLTEADVNLVLSALLGDRLEALGARVEQLRTDHRYVGLDDRVARTLALDPDLFISVHHNSVGFGTHPMKDQGPKVFYHYDHAIPVATRVAARLTDLLEPGEKPEVLRNVFRVNRNISPCPSILIEGGFVCNPYDEVRLRDPAVLERMAEAIARGVVDTLRGA